MLWVQLKNGSVFRFEGGMERFTWPAPNLAYAKVFSDDDGGRVAGRFRADEVLSVTETPPLVIGHQCQPAADSLPAAGAGI